MIGFDILGDRETAEKLSRVHGQVQRNVEATIGRLTLKLLAKVKGEKLSGQVLNTRTGRLRRSINQRVDGAGTTSIAGYVGTNVEYGRAHELGFKGTVTQSVKAHLRRSKAQMQQDLKTRKDGSIFDSRRRVSKAEIMVQAHTRTMNINLPERSFLRSALKEMTPEIQAALKAAVNQGITR